MIQSINNYRQNNIQFSQLADSVRSTWQDDVANVFYRDIIQPMQNEASMMSTNMEDLSSTLYRIKDEIDMI